MRNTDSVAARWIKIYALLFASSNPFHLASEIQYGVISGIINGKYDTLVLTCGDLEHQVGVLSVFTPQTSRHQSTYMDWNSSDAPQALKKFKALCKLYFSGPLKKKDEQEQISHLLIWSGEEGIELVSTWELKDDEKISLDTYWTKFESYDLLKAIFD